MTTTNQHGTDDAAYRHGETVVGPETEMQERAEVARLPAHLRNCGAADPDGLFDAEEEEIDMTMQSYDPRAADQPQPEKKPKAVQLSAERLLEAWYLYQTDGRLKSVGLIESCAGMTGTEEQLLISLYVEATPGFNREILLHGQHHRGEHKPWRHWYGNWPDNRALAEAIYEAFVGALRQKLRIQPFVVFIETVNTPDHLEVADAANEPNTSLRNRGWRQNRIY